MNTNIKDKILSTSKVGWHRKSFVLPDEVFGNEKIVFQSENLEATDFKTRGTLEGWQLNIGKYCVGNIPVMITVATSLAGPLLNLLNRQGFCIHLIGDSSCGKTTAVAVGASSWGPPDFIRSWSSTCNGLEGIAASRNDTCLILDEIDEAPSKEIGKMAYAVVNGQGKQRATRLGSDRQIRRWRLAALSTGERTLDSIMSEAGKKTNSGQLVRILSLPAMYECGVFSELHGFESGRAIADHLKQACASNYGTVGRAFVKKLVNDERDFLKDFDRYLDVFTSLGHSSLEKRAAISFAVTAFAGELAIEYGLLPWPPESAINAAQNAFMQWQEGQGKELTEHEKIIKAITAFIVEHGDSRFSSIDDIEQNRTHCRAGWYKDEPKGRVYMFDPTALEEAGGYQKARVSKALYSEGWLVETDKDRLTKKTRIPNVGSINLYHVRLGDMLE